MFLVTLLLFFTFNNPPGTIKIKEYYVDKTEIQNIHWLEYIYYKGQELDASELHKILPDSLNTWYQAPENRFKPIILISYGQALEFCAWRSKVVSERLGKKVTYRLPTPAEWKEIAEELLITNSKQAQKDLKESKREIEKNPKQHVQIGREKVKHRIYDFFGNVSEMTLEKGIAMGANNNDIADLNTNLNRVFKYNAPNPFLGFRCIAEVE